MLNEAMKAVRVTDMEYAQEIADLLNAAYQDLQIAGVVIDGEVDITITESTDRTTGETTYTVSDSSDIEDQLVLQAMYTYVRMHFGSPSDYDRLAASYDLQRRQLANRTGYTDFLEPEAETATPEAPEAAAETEETP